MADLPHFFAASRLVPEPQNGSQITEDSSHEQTCLTVFSGLLHGCPVASRSCRRLMSIKPSRPSCPPFGPANFTSPIAAQMIGSHVNAGCPPFHKSPANSFLNHAPR